VQTIWNDGATGPTAISALALSGPNNVGCQEADVADQIVCLTQADPCSVGYEGDGGKTWGKRQNGVQCTAGTSTTVGANAASSCIQAGVCQTLADAGLCVGTGANGDAPPYTNGTGCPTQCLGTGLVDNQASLALRIDQTYPTQTTVQQLGQQAAEYQIARKLYFSSIVGFQNLQNTANDGSAAGELALAQYMANSPATQINPILTNVGYFLLQGQTTTGGVGGTVPASTFNAPFCEDYNEVTVCGATTANNNGCTANAGQNTFLSEAVGLPSTGSICGDGHQDPYEECDDGVNNGTAGDKCSTTCRCAGTKSYDKVGGTYGCN
jgi:cysteine-rich repeat protein